VTLSHAALVSRQCPVSRGRLSTGEFRVSEASLVGFTKAAATRSRTLLIRCDGQELDEVAMGHLGTVTRLCGHRLFAAGRVFEIDCVEINQRRIGTTGRRSERNRGSRTHP
jgi:hypothetical protein